MARIDISVESDISGSARVKQLEALFDCPVTEKSKLHWSGDFPYEAERWNVGLIVGPSGAGKSTILRNQFGDPFEFEWKSPSVIDDFGSVLTLNEISHICRAVGFNTIPAWMRPFKVLSNGERFRVDLARRLAEVPDPIVVDEFTSVVDRQVAKIGAHAVQKYVRKNNRQFVAATCHYDVIEWLQPDWMFEPATMTFTRRSLQRRPNLDVTIAKIPYAAWRIFAPFHYMSAELNKSAQCFGLFVGDEIAAFAGMLHFPHATVRNIKRCSRLVTHPDWQGLGLAPILLDKLGEAYKAMNIRIRSYPAHPALIRTFAENKRWVLTKKPGTFGSRKGQTTGLDSSWRQGSRPNAVFEYIGPAMELSDARKLVQT